MHLAADHFVNHLQSLHGNLLKRPLEALWVLSLEMPLSRRLRWEKLRSTLHCNACSSRSFTAIRKDAGLCCGSSLRKGEVLAYVGRNQNLKDLKDVDVEPQQG